MTGVTVPTSRCQRQFVRRSFVKATIIRVAQLMLVMAPLGAVSAPADDVKEATKLYQTGKFDQALSKVNAALAQQPKDAQGRFIKGLIYTEQKRTADAIQIFTGLTEDYPELPEPYNNLAVLYAGQGNYDKAKAALELAIHTHPAYATAYENLGDVYAQLARRSYDKALQLDKGNAGVQTKMAMVKDLFSPPKSAGGDTAKAAPVAVAAAPAKTDPPKAAPIAKTEPAKSEPPKTEPVKAEPAKPAPAKPEPAKAEPAKPAAGNADAQVTAAVAAWAKAWAAKDVPAYLAAYASDFEPPEGLNRAAWEAQRKDRIERAKSISVEAKVTKIAYAGNEASVTIRQAYRSDTIKSDNTKVLKMVRNGDKWFIRSERAAK
ncbi:MAG: tetratricopeptide repeat protein [Betaproteobacteria bacterium]|nr:tetratricopeptide repeat protein [Betaproteobacteria bacterium]